MKKLALLIYYPKENRYSFNVLLGALEKKDIFNKIDIYMIQNKEEFLFFLRETENSYQKILILFSLLTTKILDIFNILKELKKKHPKNSLIIAGGPHATGNPEQTLKMGFDIVFHGEAERSFFNFLDAVYKNQDYYATKGIGFVKGGKFFLTEREEPVELDNYPPFSVRLKKFNPIEITRGCPFLCYFCQTPHIFGTRPRHRSIENIVKYAEIMKNHRKKDIRFISPDAFSYGSEDGKRLNLLALRELLKNLRTMLGKEGRIFMGTFPSEVRPEHVNEETLGLIKTYADNDNIVLGAQTGSERLLKKIHRGHSVEDVLRAVKLTLKSGLKVNVDFIFGLPGETVEDLKTTVEFMKELISMGARIHAHGFIPLPGTPFSSQPPGSIKPELREFINRFLPHGTIYGEWERQMEISRSISSFMKNHKQKRS